jgi:hypothetical protein
VSKRGEAEIFVEVSERHLANKNVAAAALNLFVGKGEQARRGEDGFSLKA